MFYKKKTKIALSSGGRQKFRKIDAAQQVAAICTGPEPQIIKLLSENSKGKIRK